MESIIMNSKFEEKIPVYYEEYHKWLENDKDIEYKYMIEDNPDIIDSDAYITEFSREKRISERNNRVYNKILNNFVKKIIWGKDKKLKLVKEILYLVNKNYWIKYFLKCDMHGAENWIDFELEIKNVVKSINDIIHKSISDINLYSKVTKWPKNDDGFTKEFFNDNSDITYKEVRDRLVADLNKLIRLFEIYLAEYVEKIEIAEISPDIKNLEIDFILSFNYTHIFSKVYKVSERIKKEQLDLDSFDYIHGETGINNTIESNNMVLGINEYLLDNEKDKQIEFIAFKKYYQRIHKETGCNYAKWLEIINKNPYKGRSAPKHYLYIFGHSLNDTDKDILEKFILSKNNNIFTTIYYRNLDQKGQQIANLVKVIGQDELIRRTGGGSARSIEFIKQKDMVPRNIQADEESN